MKYTAKESLQEVLDRSERVKQERECRRLGFFSLGVCALLLTLTLALASVPDLPQSDSGSAMGSFLLKAQTGGIVAAVVLAFTLGVLVTLLLIRRKKLESTKNPESQAHTDNSQPKNGGTQL